MSIRNQKGEQLKIRPINRQNKILAPVEVDKIIPFEHPARAIWQFVGKLNLEVFYSEIKSFEGGDGRSVFDPRMIISLWTLAYSEGIISARKLSKQTRYNPPYQWLTGGEVVNYHTLADFRIRNKEGLDELFVQVLGVLSASGLITLEHVMHDGTKINANAGEKSFHTEEHILEHLKLVRQLIEDSNTKESKPANSRSEGARKRTLREKKEKYEKALEELEKIKSEKHSEKDKKECRSSTTDPESRIMKGSDGGFGPNYNVQVSTDSASGVIIAIAAAQSRGDAQELLPAIPRIQKNLNQTPKQLVVDGGFSNRENILACNEQGVDFIGSLFDVNEYSTRSNKTNGVDVSKFDTGAFVYDEKANIFTCPAGKILRVKNEYKTIGAHTFSYQAQESDCQTCTFKNSCCPKFKARTVNRIVEDEAILEYRRKMETEPAKSAYKRRSEVAEFSNLWLKAKNGLRQFSLRSLQKVNSELALVALTQNIQIWIRKRWNSIFTMNTSNVQVQDDGCSPLAA